MSAIVPLQLQTLYQDLVDAHLAHGRDPDGLGAPFLRTLRGRKYWYLSYRRGETVAQRYLGPDTEETLARVKKFRARLADETVFKQAYANKVAQLRSARVLAPDLATGSMLTALADAGVFDLGATLVGTHAFRLYDLEVGQWVTRNAPTQTQDVDIASYGQLSVALAQSAQDRPTPKLAKLLPALGLSPAATLDPKGRTGVWRSLDGTLALDLLTPRFGGRDGPAWLDALEVWAQPLHFLNYLLADPIPAVVPYRHGILVRIPRPERYAIHKLIVSQDRPASSRAKARKDLAQARALILALAQDRPYELEAAYEAAVENGPRWRELIERALALMPDVKALLP